MKKIFLMFSLIFLSATKIFGQAAVDIPLSATEGTYNIQLAVGLDLTATNCIDLQLGEVDLPPPPPPPPCFDIRFDLQPYGCPSGIDTWNDYRAPSNPPAFPFTGMIQHTLLWQTSAPGLPIDIIYNIPPDAAMYITDPIGGIFLNIGPFTGQGVATIPGSYTSILSKAYLLMDYDNIVPVELISFTASVLQNEKAVQLNWSTATETNNSGFEIERKALSFGEGLGEAWNIIGFVPSFGTTTKPKSYSFTDEDVTNGSYKYRLKQIDFDGTFTYSNEIEVVVDLSPKEFVLYQNYPNPFNPNTVISYQLPVSGNVTLKVYDILGNEVATLVNEEKQPGVYEVEFDSHSDEGQNLSSGIYFYQLKATPNGGQAGSFSSIKKMVLIK